MFNFAVIVFIISTLLQYNLSRNITNEEIEKKIPKNFNEFRNSAKKPGLEIWRVEKFKLVNLPSSEYGTFYTGDSYLILNTELISSKLVSTIYFWIGENSSQDEYGAVAIYSINLRQHLHEHPSTKREEHGKESDEFLKLFPKKLKYLEGGVDSGFHHIDTDQFENKLYLIKGKRNIRVKPLYMVGRFSTIPTTINFKVAANVSSLNQDDSFVLDTKQNIYIFNGKNSKALERLKADTFASRLDQDHAGRTKKVQVDDRNVDFFQALNANKDIKIADTSSILDNDFEKDFDKNVQLLKITERGQKVYVEKINENRLTQSLLQNDDCYVLRDGNQVTFLWIGKKCNAKEKNEGSKQFPTAMKVIEKSEPALFTEYFFTWKSENEKNNRLL